MGYIVFVLVVWLTSGIVAVILSPLSIVVIALAGLLSFGNKKLLEIIGGTLAGATSGLILYAQAWVVSQFFQLNPSILWIIIAVWCLATWGHFRYSYVVVPVELAVVAFMFRQFF